MCFLNNYSMDYMGEEKAKSITQMGTFSRRAGCLRSVPEVKWRWTTRQYFYLDKIIRCFEEILMGIAKTF